MYNVRLIEPLCVRVACTIARVQDEFPVLIGFVHLVQCDPVFDRLTCGFTADLYEPGWLSEHCGDRCQRSTGEFVLFTGRQVGISYEYCELVTVRYEIVEQIVHYFVQSLPRLKLDLFQSAHQSPVQLGIDGVHFEAV